VTTLAHWTAKVQLKAIFFDDTKILLIHHNHNLQIEDVWAKRVQSSRSESLSLVIIQQLALLLTPARIPI
jgi:hypothetical protein